MARTPGGTPAHCHCMPAHGIGVLPSRLLLQNDPADTATGAGRWRAGASAEAASPESTELCCARSRATAILRRAALAGVGAAPRLLRHAPACQPVGEAGLAVEWCGGGPCGDASGRNIASFAMVLAAPGFLLNAPACLPVCESGGAVVRVSWRRRLGRIAVADVVIGAAPCLFVGSPLRPCVHCAIEGVDWSRCRRPH